MSEPTVIHAHIYDPRQPSIFGKAKANERAYCNTITCTNTDCPLLARGQCHMRGGLFGNSCPYGTLRCEEGPTKRAAKCYEFVRDMKEKHRYVPWLNPPTCKMEIIGDFVLLPYAHMTMCESVPFKLRVSLFGFGDQFLQKEFWTVETVVALIDFLPRAIMGGIIDSYQKEEVPKFLLHLRETDPEMWKQLIAVRPALDIAPNHVGRKAILTTLNHPLEWIESNKHGYNVGWKWDGETLTTESMHAFSETWGCIKAQSVVIHVKPKRGETVVVQSNAWVNEKTEFAT